MIEFFDKVEEKTSDKILYTANSLDDVVAMEELDPNCQNLSVFDDFIMDPDFHIVSEYVISSRHKNNSCLILGSSNTLVAL